MTTQGQNQVTKARATTVATAAKETDTITNLMSPLLLAAVLVWVWPGATSERRSLGRTTASLR